MHILNKIAIRSTYSQSAWHISPAVSAAWIQVDWWPWKEEAFELARSQDKPIFLSVGYSTCHWCHVMERESFESQEVADIINERFVSIKVDREERPDVDRVYMTYIQAISGGGGWPMSVFLTPTLEPIFGGTYFPPEDKYGRPGFKTVLKRVSEAWLKDRDALLNHGSHVMASIAEAVSSQGQEDRGAFSPESAKEAIALAVKQLSERFDAENGGFSRAPKFPRISEVNLVLLQHLMAKSKGQKAQAEEALKMAGLTLRKMAAGGIYDHIGGGFARYSVDEKWHVPHFEKMLYDNPQIAQTYTTAFQLTKDRRYARVVRGVLDYLLRDMRHREGGFYSAEDADSLDPKTGHKKEGEFYVWDKAEVDEVLGGGDLQLAESFSEFYYAQEDGNVHLSRMSDPHEEFTGKNVFINLNEGSLEEEEQLSEARKKLHDRRSKRPRPHLDDKVVCSWNGMAIGAFANAATALMSEEPSTPASFPVDGRDPAEYLDAAVQAAEFVESKLWDPESRRLRRSFCRGPSEVQGFDSDYAYLIAGLLDLYSANGETKWLSWAMNLQGSMDELFWDAEQGGYFSTTGQDASIKLRMKEDQDGAEPTASSIAVSNLLRLAALMADEQAQGYRERALKTLSAFSDRLESMPIALTQMCCSAFLLEAEPLRQVIIAGPKREAQGLINAANSVFCPDKVVMYLDPEDAAAMAFWQQYNPEVAAMASGAKGKAATAFVCQNMACQAPTSDLGRLKELLGKSGGPSIGQMDLNAFNTKDLPKG